MEEFSPMVQALRRGSELLKERKEHQRQLQEMEQLRDYRNRQLSQQESEMKQKASEGLWNRGYKEREFAQGANEFREQQELRNRQFSQGAGEFESQQGLRERQFQQALAEAEDKRRSGQIQDRRNAYEVINQKRKLYGQSMTPSERIRNFETSQQFAVDPQTGQRLRPDQIYNPRWGTKSAGGTGFEDVLTTLDDQGVGNQSNRSSQGYSVGDIIDGPDGRKYRVLGGDPLDPDVELIE